MSSRINHHWCFIRVFGYNLFVHLEKVTVFGFYDFFTALGNFFFSRFYAVNFTLFLTVTFDSRREIQINSFTCFVYSIACIATLFSSTWSHVTRHEVTESRVTAFQVVIAVFFGNFSRFFAFFAYRYCIFHFLRYPNTSVVTQRFRHQSQFRLIVAWTRDTSRVNLSEARVSKVSTFLVDFPSCGSVRAHRIGWKEVYVTITTRGDNYSVSRVAFNFTSNKVTSDDTTRFAVYDYHIEHFVAVVHINFTTSDLAIHRSIATEQELLSCLTFGVESTRN